MEWAHLCLQRLIKVFMFLDECFHGVKRGAHVFTCKERLPLCYPALGLLRFTIEHLCACVHECVCVCVHVCVYVCMCVCMCVSEGGGLLASFWYW